MFDVLRKDGSFKRILNPKLVGKLLLWLCIKEHEDIDTLCRILLYCRLTRVYEDKNRIKVVALLVVKG